MHNQNISEIHNRENQFVCVDPGCPGNDSMLCQQCVSSDKHQECQEKNQIIPFEKFIQVTAGIAKKKINKEDVSILHLKETIDNLQQFYQEFRRDVYFRKDLYFNLQQKIKKFKYYKNPKYLQQVKQNSAFSSDFFFQNDHEDRSENLFIKYIAEIDKSIHQMKDILNKKRIEQKPQQSIIKQIIIRSSNSSRVLSQNEIDNAHTKSEFKQLKDAEKKRDVIQQQQLLEVERNQQKSIAKVDYPYNNQIMSDQNNQQQIQQPRSSSESPIIPQQVNQMNFGYPLQNLDCRYGSSVKQQHLNSDLALESQKKIVSLINPITENMDNQSSIVKSKPKWRKSFGRLFGNSPINKIEVIDNKYLIYQSENKLFLVTEYRSNSKEKKIEKNLQFAIFDFVMMKEYPILILVQTDQGLILLNRSLDTLYTYKKIIYQNHLAIYKNSKGFDISTNFVCYLKDINQFIQCQVIENRIIQQKEKQLSPSQLSIISMKVINNSLYVGYHTGKVIIYDLQNWVEQKNFQIQTGCRDDFPLIFFEVKFCLAIQKNQLYRINYDKEIIKLCSTIGNIISCAYYIDDEKKKYEFHLLQENNKIHLCCQKNDESYNRERQQQSISCVSYYLDQKQPKFIYGENGGGIQCYYS
ncbi:unnamed protein product [Paramecium octaurelia]|uniref:Uncharacterized protein n=1 Tax=Paramecium octaurelia TaxID=43137 RepID=A0A8S1WVW7_PAROT|nr:unnamed protein product [Paramecium octaurelia]